MRDKNIVREIVRVANLIGSADTFKCPECGTKVLENTSYCVKCKKKVKKAATRPNGAYHFANEMKRIKGVDSVDVNDFAKLSSNPDVYEVDVFVYVDPAVGGRMTRTLQARAKQIAKKLNVDLESFWSPRGDRTMNEIGTTALRRFYENNPYKITLTVFGDDENSF